MTANKAPTNDCVSDRTQNTQEHPLQMGNQKPQRRPTSGGDSHPSSEAEDNKNTALKTGNPPTLWAWACWCLFGVDEERLMD